MPRATNGPATKARKRRAIRAAKGYFGNKSRLYVYALEAVQRAQKFAYRDRRKNKSTFRQLWIVRLNAACRNNGISYSRFIDRIVTEYDNLSVIFQFVTVDAGDAVYRQHTRVRELVDNTQKRPWSTHSREAVEEWLLRSGARVGWATRRRWPRCPRLGVRQAADLRSGGGSNAKSFQIPRDEVKKIPDLSNV